MTSHPIVYLRALYRLPLVAASALACFLLARATGDRRFVAIWARLASRICGRRLVITGVPCDPAARLVIANHVSYIDLIPIFRLWPHCHPVAADYIQSWFLVGPLLRGSAIFVDDDDHESRSRARAEMRAAWNTGRTVLVFPEGPIERGRGHFQTGSFEEAVAAGVSVQGVRIGYSPELLAALGGKRFGQRFFWVLSQNFEVRLHLFPAERAAGDPAALCARWESRLLSPRLRSDELADGERGRISSSC